MKIDGARLFAEKERVVLEKLTSWAALCRTPGYTMNENYIWRIKQRGAVWNETVKKFIHYGFIIDNIKPLPEK